MSPKRPCKSGVTAFAALLAGVSAIYAAEPVSAPAGGLNSVTAPASGVDSAANARGDAEPSGQNQPVCFKLTLHCIDSKSAKPDADSTPRTASAGPSRAQPNAGSGKADSGQASPSQPLNLNAPDVRTVVPAEELRQPVQTEEQQQAAEDADTVQVKGDSTTPEVPGGFGALWWAMKHPSEAWRIFTPVE